MKTITIYHGYDADGSMVFPLGDSVTPDLLVRMYSYEDSDAININGVYRDNNAVTGDEINVKNKARSLSIGDVVDIDGTLFLCNTFGWTYPAALPGSIVNMEDIRFLMNEFNRRSAI